MRDDFSNITIDEEENQIFSVGELSKRLAEQKALGQETKPIFSYYDELDKITEGFYPGELIILSAPTKQGKTTWCQSLTLNLAEHEIGVLWFTLEMSWQEITKKFSLMSDKISNLPIFYPIDNSKLCVTWIEEVARKAIEQKGVKLIIIDHLHFLLPLRDFHTNISFLVGGIVRDIKKLAVALKVPIILICHPGMVHEETKISWRNIRDSSFITQESDFTIVMHRVYEKTKMGGSSELLATNEAELSVELDRRTGKTGKVILSHIDGRFYDARQLVESSGLAEPAEVSQKFTPPDVKDIEF